MDRWKSEDPCANVDGLARSMPNGLWMNILTADIDLAVAFQIDVLGCDAIYRDKAFAIMSFEQSSWMVHSDHTYAEHPLSGRLASGTLRGSGCEIRLHGCDPDAAQKRAEDFGFEVMAEARDRPHGLREAFLVGPDGYIWVPSILKTAADGTGVA